LATYLTHVIKQVRSRTDHGTVVCLDPRIVTKQYGRLFIESLPDCRRVEAALGRRPASKQKPGFADRSGML